jgi:hypothetical protein
VHLSDNTIQKVADTLTNEARELIVV